MTGNRIKVSLKLWRILSNLNLNGDSNPIKLRVAICWFFFHGLVLDLFFFAHMTPIAICWSIQSFTFSGPIRGNILLGNHFYTIIIYNAQERERRMSLYVFIFIASLFIVWSIFFKKSFFGKYIVTVMSVPPMFHTIFTRNRSCHRCIWIHLRSKIFSPFP